MFIPMLPVAFDWGLSPGLSPEAVLIENKYLDYRESQLKNISSLPKMNVLVEIDNVADNCANSNWDGYDAFPVENTTYFQASQFASAIPSWTLPPAVSAEPDGAISFEWYSSPRKIFSVSIGADGGLSFAGIFGASKVHGFEPFFDTIPSIILEYLRKFS